MNGPRMLRARRRRNLPCERAATGGDNLDLRKSRPIASYPKNSKCEASHTGRIPHTYNNKNLEKISELLLLYTVIGLHLESCQLLIPLLQGNLPIVLFLFQ